ncbi:MAG: response regulator transcription factor [Actinomycetota bacterium]|nr:response regulator transcription factor [Actinomycetota bacterium]
MRLLVVEDDPGLQSVLQRGLQRAGYVVDVVEDGERALRFLTSYDYEAVVLDWRMPGMSGLEVLREARRQGMRTPVLMLTAKDTTADRVEGLDAGADDYLVKPFQFSELLARVRALQRRPPLTLSPHLVVGDLRFDPAELRVTRGGTDLPLTGREMAILELLMRRYPAVVDRRSIALQVWDDEADAVGSNTIDVHLGRLRAKIAGGSVQIATVRGIGYKLVDG